MADQLDLEVADVGVGEVGVDLDVLELVDAGARDVECAGDTRGVVVGDGDGDGFGVGCGESGADVGPCLGECDGAGDVDDAEAVLVIDEVAGGVGGPAAVAGVVLACGVEEEDVLDVAPGEGGVGLEDQSDGAGTAGQALDVPPKEEVQLLEE